MTLFPKFVAAALLGLALTNVTAAQAQANRGQRARALAPSWGPALPAGAQYYYIPELRGYYDVPARQYVVPRKGQWFRTNNLTGYEPSKFHPVVVDYVGGQPWSRDEEYRTKYSRRGDDQNDDNDDNDDNNDNQQGNHDNGNRHDGDHGNGNGNGNGNGGYDNGPRRDNGDNGNGPRRDNGGYDNGPRRDDGRYPNPNLRRRDANRGEDRGKREHGGNGQNNGNHED